MVATLVSGLATVLWTGLPVIANRFSYSSTSTPFARGGRVTLGGGSRSRDFIYRHRPQPYTWLTVLPTVATPNSDEAPTTTSSCREGGCCRSACDRPRRIFIRESRRLGPAPDLQLLASCGSGRGLVALRCGIRRVQLHFQEMRCFSAVRHRGAKPQMNDDAETPRPRSAVRFCWHHVAFQLVCTPAAFAQPVASRRFLRFAVSSAEYKPGRKTS